MKKVLAYFIFSLFVIILTGFLLAPQDKDFDQQWQQVEKFEKDGLPKSAIKVVDEIYLQAKAEGNEPQVLKSLIYRVSLQSRFEEDHLLGAIQQFEKELETAKTPEKQILHSLSAELYQWYFNNNRWKIIDRGIVEGFETEDIKTWDAQQLSEVIRYHFMASITDQAALEKIKLSSFSSILVNTEKSSLLLWPSLYDLLANRALEYLGSANASMYDFVETTLNNPELFSNASDFVKLDLKLDTASSQFKIMSLYQRLLAFHLNQDTPEAFLDLDLKRLSYVFNNSPQSEETQTSYMEALVNLENEFSDSDLSVKVSALLARQHMNLASLYNPLQSEKYRYELNTAEEICKASIEKFSDSKDIILCKNLVKEINQTSYSLQVNAAEIPGKPFLAYLSFRNTNQLFFKAVKVDPEETINSFNYNNSNKEETYLNREAAYTWSQQVPETKDHQTHATELSLPAMEKGNYLIFVSNNENFGDKSSIVYQSVWITNLSYLAKNNEATGALEMFVLDRMSGHAVEGVEVTTYSLVYNQNTRAREVEKIGNFYSDENGSVNIGISEKGKQNQLFFTLKKDNDLLSSHQQFSLYKRKADTKVRTKTYFFTDRAIYRPGQTVYFKGIVVDKGGDDVSIKPNFDVEVSFYDANRKNVKSTALKTNEFGSFHGAFVIPTGGLNGSMRIKNKSGSINFLVEEYKRPTFEVVFDTVKEKYKLGDEITVTGKAENFAGSLLQNAEVTYRVVQTPMIVPYFRGYQPFPTAKEIEIANGTVLTNENGSFSIQFPSSKNEAANEKMNFPQRFMVYATVTDITGEVQSSSTNVLIGKNALMLTILSDDKLQKEQNNGIQVSAVNLSGAAVKADVDLKVFQLTPPDKIFVEQYWGRPDLVTITEESFRENFPNAVYENETDKDQWKRQLVHSSKTTVEGKTTLLKDFLTEANAGEYLVEATSISEENDTTQAKQFFTLFSSEGKKLPGKMLSWSVVTKTKAEPGETIQLIVGSAEKKSKIYYEIMNGDQLVQRSWVTVSRGQKVIDIPVMEAYRGNFVVRTSLVRLNRDFIESHLIEVPFTNKKLDITLETHRDFLTPGKKEEWRVKVAGPGGEKLATELIAGMYDASLDKFSENYWDLQLYQSKQTRSYWNTGYFRSTFSKRIAYQQLDLESAPVTLYPEINWFNYQNYGNRGDLMRRDVMAAGVNPGESVLLEDAEFKNEKVEDVDEIAMEDVVAVAEIQEEEKVAPLRTNFNETAFFYPQLNTDSLGNVVFTFTTPDALTEWKLMMLATSKDLKTGQLVEKFKAHKDLMIIPNLPRFVREGDNLTFSAKVVNFTDKPLRGSAEIEFFDALTLKTINIFSSGRGEVKTLNIGAGKSQLVDWEISIPAGLSMIGYRIKATSGDFTDGEERLIPVLTNRMLVTETMPLPVKANQTKTFTFQKLVDSERTMQMSTRTNYKLTLEFTSNPAWYAVQALPYLETPQTESVGNLFRQYFANALSGYVFNSNPKIKNVIESWKQITPDAFYSNLQKNEELKNIVLNATPWVLESEDEEEQKRRIALLFDVNRMANQQSNSLEKLQQNQLPSGAWSWFKGMREDRHTTQNIVLGVAKLHDKGVIDLQQEDKLRRMINKAVTYLDKELEKDFEKLKKNNSKYKTTNHLGSNQIEYLYARSILLEELPIPASSEEAFNYYSAQAKKYWLKENNYLQGMIALTLFRLGSRNEAEGIMRSLKERALFSDEMGMYWRTESGWNWYQAPVETQAMIIEAYAQILNDPKSVELMKVWLLKQKQTTRWNTSTATAEAVFALLLTGENLLDNDQLVKIKMGNEQINPRQVEGMKIEPGTGYFKTSFLGKEIKPAMGKIEVENPNRGIAWGAAYWQYFEDLDRITGHDSPLSVEKIIFIEELTDEGPVIRPMENGQALSNGDRIVVRLVIKTDREMDYVHLKDMRATALEPVNALSGYTYSGGLGFYKSVTDVSTEFFIRRLPKGTFVLEYPMAVTQKGNFSNGIATIQSYYAPEFAAHSEGTRIVVK